MKPVAILPARGGSKRLPRKNILPVAGRPMIGWTIETCLKSNVFDSVIVSSEDEEIKKVAIEEGARVISRPPEFATDTVHEFLAYRHVLDTLAGEGEQPEYFCGVYPTAIALLPEDLAGGYKKIVDDRADVVIGVSTYDIHPYKALEKSANGYLQPVYPEWCPKQSQTFPHYVASNGTFYFHRTAYFLNHPTYYPEKLGGYEIPAERAVDVDTPEDYKLLNFMMEYKRNKQ